MQDSNAVVRDPVLAAPTQRCTPLGTRVFKARSLVSQGPALVVYSLRTQNGRDSPTTIIQCATQFALA
jgi:hypothetical protein